MIEIHLLRHAETDFNAHNRFIGGRSNHIPLSENGRQQAKQAGEKFRNKRIQFEKIFCSPAIRTKETLEIILEETLLTNNPIEYSNDLQELSQGEWEGKLRDEIYTSEQLTEINANNWLFKPPKGESQKEVEERMLNFIGSNILNQYTDGKFLIVGHGVAFKCLLRNILGITSQEAYKLKIDNASIIRLKFNERIWKLFYKH